MGQSNIVITVVVGIIVLKLLAVHMYLRTKKSNSKKTIKTKKTNNDE